jgi:hypothetical protein
MVGFGHKGNDLEVDAFFMILICGMYYKCENDES